MPFGKGSELERLLSISTGFRQAKIILLAVDLSIFDLFSRERMSAADVAETLELDPRATAVFLDALVGLQALNKEEGLYGNDDVAERFLVSHNPEYKGDMFKHTHAGWDDWSGLEGVLRTGEPAAETRKKFLTEDEAMNRSFILCMFQRGWERAETVWRSVSLKGVGRMLDLGGGPGTYCLVAALQEPTLRCVVFDLPMTVEIAKEKIAEYGLEDRITTCSGNFHEDDIGSDFDLILVSNVLHSISEDEIASLLHKCYNATRPGGRLVIHDFDIREDGTGPLESAIFSVHMLVATSAGRVYTPGELCAHVSGAGYQRTENMLTADGTRVIVGTR